MRRCLRRLSFLFFVKIRPRLCEYLNRWGSKFITWIFALCFKILYLQLTYSKVDSGARQRSSSKYFSNTFSETRSVNVVFVGPNSTVILSIPGRCLRSLRCAMINEFHRGEIGKRILAVYPQSLDTSWLIAIKFDHSSREKRPFRILTSLVESIQDISDSKICRMTSRGIWARFRLESTIAPTEFQVVRSWEFDSTRKAEAAGTIFNRFWRPIYSFQTALQ